ncbi:MAG TPA: hypothetical protein VEI97_09240 [bacterium]|nr:hypothetical protein [bacterium]
MLRTLHLTGWRLPSAVLALGVAAGLAPAPGFAQAVNVSAWAPAAAGDGLWLSEDLRWEPARRGTWVRFNNVDAVAFASPGDVVPIPVEFEAAFDPSSWGGGDHQVYAEVITRVDGEVVFTERIPATGYFEGGTSVTAHRTALLGIGEAPADGELTIEHIGVLFEGAGGTAPAGETTFLNHPYFGGSGANNTAVLREVRRVSHLRVDNPFILDNINIQTAGNCPGPITVQMVARTAYGGRNAAHPGRINVRASGIADEEGWDFSPEGEEFTLGPGEHRQLEFTGIHRAGDPCETYTYEADLEFTASGTYNVIPPATWPLQVQNEVRDYWAQREWEADFMVGTGPGAQPMPIRVAGSCTSTGPDCTEVSLEGDMVDGNAMRFKEVERTPRAYEGAGLNPNELTVYLPAAAIEGETVLGTVVATGESMARLGADALEQIVINNETVQPYGETLRNEDESAAAQQFTATLTGGGGIARAAVVTERGPVEFSTITVFSQETTPSTGDALLLANVPDVFSWNPEGTPLWSPGDNVTSPIMETGADAYEPMIPSTDPVAPLITGVPGSGAKQLVAMTDEEVRAGTAASPQQAIAFLDSLSEGYRAWARNPYKDAMAIVAGTAPVYLQPGGTYTYLGPVPTPGGPYAVSGGAVVRDEGRGYAQGWDPNKTAVENIVLMDPQTGQVLETLPTFSQSSVMMTGYVPDDLQPGMYNVGLQTNDGQVLNSGNRSIAVQMITEGDPVVQRGSTGIVRLEVSGHEQGKEEEQEEESEDGKQLRPELRYFWSTLAAVPGDWKGFGYSPRRGSFLTDFAGTTKPEEGEGEATAGNQDENDMWNRKEEEPELYVLVYNMTPEVIRFDSGQPVMELPVYADTTELAIPFTGIQSGTYGVRIEVKEPIFKALEPENMMNLDPEKNPLLKMAGNDWHPEVLDDYGM